MGALCGGGGDNGAAEAQRREAERQRLIQQRQQQRQQQQAAAKRNSQATYGNTLGAGSNYAGYREALSQRTDYSLLGGAATNYSKLLG